MHGSSQDAAVGQRRGNPLSDSREVGTNPYRILRWTNKPERVRYLLIGESPPDPQGGPIRFFYHPEYRKPDNLYVGIVTALYGAVVDLDDKRRHLARLKGEGWWLVDAVDYPINLKSDSVRRRAIREEFPALQDVLLRPDVQSAVGAIICMPRVFEELAGRIQGLGLSILHEQPIPFPLGKGHPAFLHALRQITRI
jgi:hypothetical protein